MNVPECEFDCPDLADWFLEPQRTSVPFLDVVCCAAHLQEAMGMLADAHVADISMRRVRHSLPRPPSAIGSAWIEGKLEDMINGTLLSQDELDVLHQSRVALIAMIEWGEQVVEVAEEAGLFE